MAIIDTQAPTAACTGDQQECTGALTAVTTSCSGGDVCDQDVDAASTAEASYALGGHVFECTATDDSGNTDTTTCDVAIVDTQAPTAACTGDQQECTGALTAVTTSCSGSDVCDQDVEVASTAVASYPVGAHAFECTATDDVPRMDTVTCDVVIVDTIAPVLSCADDVVVDADEVCIGHADPTATATDICDGTPDVVRDPAGTEWGLGDTDVLHTATDADGNWTDCVSVVTVQDVTPPTIDCNLPADLNLSASPLPQSFTAVGDDNCSVEVSVAFVGCTKVHNKTGEDVPTDCAVTTDGATVTISEIGKGKTAHWTATSVDGSGNSVTIDCSALRGACNQGVGNGPEDCDPGNSNQGDPDNSNDENGGTPGNPGSKGGKKK